METRLGSMEGSLGLMDGGFWRMGIMVLFIFGRMKAMRLEVSARGIMHEAILFAR